ncbi:MAG: DoxX family membrane protein [Bryobacterales bacterium]|nr:DoxX family membrane protein [Bryobacterales bacterium]
MAARIRLALRLVLGAVFLYAAWSKLRQPWLVFALSVDSYRILPAWMVFAVARTLPWLELLLGLLLLAGRYLRYAAPACTLLLLVFHAAMVRAYLSGLGIDCGCFGVGEAVSPATLVRDGALLAGAAALWFLVYRRERHEGSGTRTST